MVWCGGLFSPCSAFTSKRQDSSLQVSTQLPTPVAVLWHCFCSEASNPAVGWQGTCLWVDGEVVWAGTLVVRWCCNCNMARRCWRVLVCLAIAPLRKMKRKMKTYRSANSCALIWPAVQVKIFASSDMTD